MLSSILMQFLFIVNAFISRTGKKEYVGYCVHTPDPVNAVCLARMYKQVVPPLTVFELRKYSNCEHARQNIYICRDYPLIEFFISLFEKRCRAMKLKG